MTDPESLLSSALQQVQIAATQIKQQYSIEAKMWQTKSQELQTVIDSLQTQLLDAQKANAEMKAALEEASVEVEVETKSNRLQST
jgi:hypothetical protein